MKYISKEKKYPFKTINNLIYILKEMNNSIFNNVDNYKLDYNQKKAIIAEEKNLLVVAGAGSGKTLTIIGKVMYLLSKGVKRNEIICISFTNNAAQNLKKKIRS